MLSGALRTVLGAVGGLIVAAVGALLRNRRAGAEAGPDIPAPWGPMWASLRSFDEHTRDGVRRAIPLAIGMFLYRRTLDHDSLWVFLAAFAVLLLAGKTAVRIAAARVISTIVGMLVLSVLGLVGVAGVLFTVAILFLLVGIAYQPTYPLPAGALSAMGAVLLVAGPAGNLGAWAGHRLLDTLLAARWPSPRRICSGRGTHHRTTTTSPPKKRVRRTSEHRAGQPDAPEQNPGAQAVRENGPPERAAIEAGRLPPSTNQY